MSEVYVILHANPRVHALHVEFVVGLEKAQQKCEESVYPLTKRFLLEQGSQNDVDEWLLSELKFRPEDLFNFWTSIQKASAERMRDKLVDPALKPEDVSKAPFN